MPLIEKSKWRKGTQTLKLYPDIVQWYWVPFDMVMMWVEVLFSVSAQCDKVANLKENVHECESSLSYCHDAAFLNGNHLGRWTQLTIFLPFYRA